MPRECPDCVGKVVVRYFASGSRKERLSVGRDSEDVSREVPSSLGVRLVIVRQVDCGLAWPKVRRAPIARGSPVVDEPVKAVGDSVCCCGVKIREWLRYGVSGRAPRPLPTGTREQPARDSGRHGATVAARYDALPSLFHLAARNRHSLVVHERGGLPQPGGAW